MKTQTATKVSTDTTIPHLESLLADSYALMAQTHLAHWNVEGSDFFQLHAAFEEQYRDLFEAVDDIAERIRALGGYSPGGLKMLSEMSHIGAMDRKMSARDMVAHLIDFHETLVSGAKEGRNAAAESGDSETEDLLIARIQVHQKTIWMLKSVLKQ